jgi:hypothetical protein
MAVTRLSNSSIVNGLPKYKKFWDSFTYGSHVSSGLALYLDAGNPLSYSGSGSTWTDLSGNGNNGSLSNVTYSSADGGRMQFNGTSSFVNCGNSSSVNITGPITINIIFNTTNWLGNNVWRTLVSKGDSSYRFQNPYNSTFTNFGTSGLSQIDTAGTISILPNRWYMATAVWDGTSKKIYINGLLDVNVAVTGTLSGNSFDLYIGENSQANSRYYTGSISVVQIYNRALTQQEITQNFGFFRKRYGI